MNVVIGGFIGLISATALTFGGAQALDSTGGDTGGSGSKSVVVYTDE